MPAPALSNSVIVVTGATGQVGLPVASQLAAAGNEVWAPARFSSPEARASLEAAGVRCVVADLGAGSGFGDLPADGVDYVLNFAVAKTSDSDADLVANAESVGLLMDRFRSARAFLQCSSTGVYAPGGGVPVTESSPLGDNNHRNMMPNYVHSKIAAEAVARTCARLFSLPTVVTRLNVPYGSNGGWPWWQLLMVQGGMTIPVPPDGGVYNPIHEDDIVRTLPALLDAASVPALTVNWAGSEPVSIPEWVAYLGELTGLSPTFADDASAIEGVPTDVTKLRSIVGEPTTVSWKDGLRRMVETRAPELLKG